VAGFLNGGRRLTGGNTEEVRFGWGGFGTVGSTGGASWARGARRLGAKQRRRRHTRTSRTSMAGQEEAQCWPEYRKRPG
jgi:hypothetical protein